MAAREATEVCPKLHSPLVVVSDMLVPLSCGYVSLLLCCLVTVKSLRIITFNNYFVQRQMMLVGQCQGLVY